MRWRATNENCYKGEDQKQKGIWEKAETVKSKHKETNVEITGRKKKEFRRRKITIAPQTNFGC